jgi:NADH-ubiquinone oxidoreductase chain 6
MIRLTLVAQTGLVGFQAWCLSMDRWYTLILFLIFLGGVLVLLIYISCLAQNETTTLRIPLSLVAWTLPIGMLIPSCYNQSASLNWIRATKLFGWELSILILGLILYLLLGLVAVVKLTKYYFGALRRTECLFSVVSTLLFQGRRQIKLPSAIDSGPLH